MCEKIAILIPCFNEELTIKKVINDFQKELPKSKIYVYNNNSTDNTANVARESGATIVDVSKKGKGNVVRAMFMDIDADIYIMIDGDDTYPVKSVHKLLKPIVDDKVDMVIGDRHTNGSYDKQNSRNFHSFGNNLVKYLINKLYQENLRDVMSGFRVFNRNFVKHFPVHSKGFEIETEMSMHALDKCYRIQEIDIDYKDRPSGSVSKLNTISDGAKILRTIFRLFKDYKPLTFFSCFSLIFFLLALIAGVPVIVEFIQTSYINKVPSAILSVGLMLVSIQSLFAGFILDTIVRQHRENFELSRLHRT